MSGLWDYRITKGQGDRKWRDRKWRGQEVEGTGSGGTGSGVDRK